MANQKKKIVCISDTHCQQRAFDSVHGGLPYGDVLIHAGDALTFGKADEFYAFANWISKQPHLIKLYVPGNHDFFVQGNLSLCRNILRERGVVLLVDQAFIIRGTLPEEDIKVYGTPWVPNLSGWAFFAHKQTLVNRFNDIPDDTQLLITHAPPSSILDSYPGEVILIDGPNPHGLEEEEYNDERGLHVGSTALLKRVSELKHLKLHVFGHIHSSYGIEIVKFGKREVKFVNASSCYAGNIFGRKPIVVEI